MSCRYDICNLARRTCQLQSRLTLSLLWVASLCCLLGSWNLDMRWVQFQHSRPGWLNMKILQPLVGRSFFSCSVFVQKKIYSMFIAKTNFHLDFHWGVHLVSWPMNKIHAMKPNEHPNKIHFGNEPMMIFLWTNMKMKMENWNKNIDFQFKAAQERCKAKYPIAMLYMQWPNRFLVDGWQFWPISIGSNKVQRQGSKSAPSNNPRIIGTVSILHVFWAGNQVWPVRKDPNEVHSHVQQMRSPLMVSPKKGTYE